MPQKRVQQQGRKWVESEGNWELRAQKTRSPLELRGRAEPFWARDNDSRKGSASIPWDTFASEGSVVLVAY